jgi:hypothetical protein
MSLRTSTIAIGLLTGLVCLQPGAQAAAMIPFSGGIGGQVKNTAGIAQMGASVLLFDRHDQLIRQTITNENGRFVFDALAPELYSVRVTLASFVPAVRRNIAVAVGSHNILDINLTNLLSSIDLSASTPTRGTLMTDDWKWILRTSQSTRPILRALPGQGSSSSQPLSAAFSDTVGMVRLSAGDGNSFATGNQQDLGTAFALATSVYGLARVQFSGNLGYAGSSGLPAAGFRTAYSRSGSSESDAQLTLTVRQLYLPSRSGSNAMTDTSGGPVLRTAALTMIDKVSVNDRLRVDYGGSLESVSFLQRLNYVSPFARATYDVDEHNALRFAYSSGSDPTELLSRGDVSQDDLSQNLTALAAMPRVSMRDGQAHVQRTQTLEAGLRSIHGKRTYSIGVYHETVANAAFTVSGPAGFVADADSLPDLGSRSFIFNAGSYKGVGITAAVSQSFGDHLEASISAGQGDALITDSRAAVNADDLRSSMRATQRPWVTARVSGTIPFSGTRIVTSYGWTDYNALMPAHVFLTQASTQETGWNVRMHQPVPAFSGLPGRFEATIEMRNLAADGYLPIVSGTRRALLTNSPRAVRGGLSFIF